MSRSFLILSIALLVASVAFAGGYSTRLAASDAIRIAKDALEQRGFSEPRYWIEIIKYHQDRDEWWVHFADSELVIDGSPSVFINDKTGEICFVLGIGMPECALQTFGSDAS